MMYLFGIFFICLKQIKLFFRVVIRCTSVNRRCTFLGSLVNFYRINSARIHLIQTWMYYIDYICKFPMYLYCKQIPCCSLFCQEYTTKCPATNWFYNLKIIYRGTVFGRMYWATPKTAQNIIFQRSIFINYSACYINLVIINHFT